MRIRSFEYLMKYLEKYKNNPQKMSKIKENFIEYLSLCNQQNIMIFISKIKNIYGMENTLYYEAASIYKKFGIEAILRMTKEMSFKKRFKYIYEMYEGCRLKYYTLDEYVEDLIANNEREYICENMQQLIDLENIQSLIKLGILEKLRQLDPDKFKEMHSAIVYKMTNMQSQSLDAITLYGLTEIVNEIAQNENVDISNIEHIGSGTMTNVYKLGNKVIKFGKKRMTNKIPYHKRILQPLLRRSILSGDKDLYIEISEYLLPDNSITDEDAYLIYKELRDDGIIWLDAKKENLGRLQKDNIAHFKEPLYVRNETVGYIPETIQEDATLPKGDLVILDTDFLFREQDFNVKFLDSRINTNFYRVCEQRYQREKNWKIPSEKTGRSTNIMEK